MADIRKYHPDRVKELDYYMSGKGSAWENVSTPQFWMKSQLEYQKERAAQEAFAESFAYTIGEAAFRAGKVTGKFNPSGDVFATFFQRTHDTVRQYLEKYKWLPSG